LENQYIVRSRHAHAWTLAYIAGKWQAFDPTPSDWESMEEDALPGAFLSDLWSLLSYKILLGCDIYQVAEVWGSHPAGINISSDV
jgi:transglutaminase-like putative cysteine protease